MYEKEGEEGVLNFAHEKIESALYNEGQYPQLIKFADYVRWKKSANIVFGISDEEEDFNEAKSHFREHGWLQPVKQRNQNIPSWLQRRSGD